MVMYIIGNELILVWSAGLVAVGMSGFAFAHAYASSTRQGLQLGGGGLNTSTNALIPDLYPERHGPIRNVLGIFYGIGALCFGKRPVISSLCVFRPRLRGKGGEVGSFHWADWPAQHRLEWCHLCPGISLGLRRTDTSSKRKDEPCLQRGVTF
jgi:MFS family permease